MTYLDNWRAGLWAIVEGQTGEGVATPAQLRAVRWLVGNMPEDAVLSGTVAHELLCARSYVVGLLVSLEREGVRPHPIEAMAVVMAELFAEPVMIRAVVAWSGQRFLHERGPARVGATRYAGLLGDRVRHVCRSERPAKRDAVRLTHDRLRQIGLGALVDAARVRIVYDSGGERTSRTITQIELVSLWPTWAAYLIDPSTYMLVDAFCHLRNDRRTFNLMNVVSAVPA